MPLRSGKGSFKTNVKTLMGEIGKSPHVQSRAQALAIAYSKERGHADGGSAAPWNQSVAATTQPMGPWGPPPPGNLDRFFGTQGGPMPLNVMPQPQAPSRTFAAGGPTETFDWPGAPPSGMMGDMGPVVPPGAHGTEDAADPIIRRFGYNLLKGMMRKRMGLDSGPFTKFDDTATPQQNARMNQFGQPATADTLRDAARRMEIEGMWNKDNGTVYGPQPSGPGSINMADGGEIPEAPIGAYGVGNETLGPLTSAVGQSLISRLSGQLGAIGQAATAPGRAVSGQLGDETEEAWNMAKQLMGVGLMGAPGGSAGLFGGVLSKGADLQALSNARLMEGAGMHRDMIWKNTGWGRDPTGKWFYEIPDNKAGVHSFYNPEEVNIPQSVATRDPSGATTGVGPAQLSDVIMHPELKGTYPDINKLPLERLPNVPEAQGILGGYHPYDPKEGPEGFIFRNKLDAETLGSAGLHETQHAIQEREGFPQGASPQQFIPPDFHKAAAAYDKAGQQMVEDLKARGIDAHEWAKEIKQAHDNGWQPLDNKNKPLPPLGQGAPDDIERLLRDMLGGYDDRIKEFNTSILPKIDDELKSNFTTLFNAQSGLKKAQDEAVAKYHRVAGEVQARNVQKRWQMTPEERRANPPWTTQDVPDIQQITRADGGGTPWTEKAGYRTLVHEGFLHAPTPGRTDNLHIGVPSGSYVVPSSVVSALGQDNSLAGSRVLNGLFSRKAMAAKMTMGMRAQHANKKIPGMAMQKSPMRIKLPSFASGGASPGGANESLISRFAGGGHSGPHIPIIAAGGEFVIHPDVVKHLGGGDIEKGHRILDKFVVEVRKKHIKTLKNLPGPKKA